MSWSDSYTAQRTWSQDSGSGAAAYSNSTQSFVFDGSSTYLATASNWAGAPAGGTAISVTAWFKCSSGGYFGFMCNNNSTFYTGGFSFRVNIDNGPGNPRLEFLMTSTSGSSTRLYDVLTANNNTIIDGSWNHLCVTDDGTYQSNGSGTVFYINGSSVAVSTVAHSAITTTGAPTNILVCGIDNTNEASSDGYTAGRLSNLAFWNGTKLSSTQISTLYNTPLQNYATLGTPPTNWWRAVGPNDTTSTIVDYINGVNFSVQGSGAFATDVP